MARVIANDGPMLHDESAISASVADEHHEKTLNRITFGSCSNQKLPQPLWPHIASFKPDLFLWLGDAIYPDSPNPERMATDYSQQLHGAGYQAFLADGQTRGMIVDGTYDDHDYGRNDGGKEFRWKEQSLKLFLDFIGVPPHSKRRQRRGAYWSVTYGNNPTEQVKVIILDTRFDRDPAVVPGVFAAHFPFGSFIGAFFRAASAIMGLDVDYSGDILGKEQWTWLESQLRSPEAAVTIIVSSIQVVDNSSNAIIGGGLDVLIATLAGVDFKSSGGKLESLSMESTAAAKLSSDSSESGDVHFAELSSASVRGQTVDAEGSSPVCYREANALICDVDAAHRVIEWVLRKYEGHRIVPSAVYEGKNFGILDIDWQSDRDANSTRPSLTLRIMNEEGRSSMTLRVHNASHPALPTASGGGMKSFDLSYLKARSEIAPGTVLCLLTLTAFGLWCLFAIARIYLGKRVQYPVGHVTKRHTE